MRPPDRRRARALSLVELLIAVAVMGILATIAYPSYLAYKVRSNRAAAQSLLIDLANRQQLYLLDARMYASTLHALGAAPLPAAVANYYNVADPVVDNEAAPPNFIISAAARPGTMQAKDGDLSVNSAGVRSGHW